MTNEVSGPILPKARVLDAVREKLATKHYSPRTVEAYVGRIRRFIIFHTVGSAAASEFLTKLATTGGVSAST